MRRAHWKITNSLAVALREQDGESRFVGEDDQLCRSRTYLDYDFRLA
jgi:hypothetical protein